MKRSTVGPWSKGAGRKLVIRYDSDIYMGVSINGPIQTGRFKREHPMKMDDLGVPFMEAPIYLGNRS